MRAGGRLAALLLGAFALLVSAGAARAQDNEDAEPTESDAFWAGVAHPHRARYSELVAQAVSRFQAGDHAAAADLLEQAVKLDPSEPLGFYLLGLSRKHLEQHAACADALAVVERLRPGYLPPAPRLEVESVGSLLGDCSMKASRFDEAAAHFRRMLGTGEPGLGADAIHANLGDCYQALGRLDEAIEEYALAAAATPKSAAPLFGLAVALDRDEQVARAHDAMARGLALDSQLAHLTAQQHYFFVPVEDDHYYHGLAYQMAAANDPAKRTAAIVRFRRYLQVAGQGPWAKRARAHLAELGPPVVGPGDILISPVDAPEREAAVRAVLAVAGDLQKCMDEDRTGWVRASLRLYPSAKTTLLPPRAPPPGLMRPLAAAPEVDRVSTMTPDGPVSRQAIDCIEKLLRTVKLPVRQFTTLQVPVIARSP